LAKWLQKEGVIATQGLKGPLKSLNHLKRKALERSQNGMTNPYSGIRIKLKRGVYQFEGLTTSPLRKDWPKKFQERNGSF